MAEVYRGYHAALDRYVAIKLLHPFLADDPEFKDRFENEARNVARLRHPNIVQVYDFEYDAEGDSYYMVMEMINGPTLKDRLFDLDVSGEQLDLAETIRVVKSSAEALAYAHQRNMIHRDVKPANLMIDEDGRVVLTDFGIAKIVTGAQFTASGGMVGTPAYMAPEQGLGEAGDERSDIYSLGVILYQLVTGRLPYDADTPLAIILKHVNEPLVSPTEFAEIPPDLEEIVCKSLEKEPTDRYQTAIEFAQDLSLLDEHGNRRIIIDPVTGQPISNITSPFDTKPAPPTAAQRAMLLEAAKAAGVDATQKLPMPETVTAQSDSTPPPMVMPTVPTDSLPTIPQPAVPGAPGRLRPGGIIGLFVVITVLLLLALIGFGNDDTPIASLFNSNDNTAIPAVDFTGTAVALQVTPPSETPIPTNTPEDTPEPTFTDTPDPTTTDAPTSTESPTLTSTPTPEPTNTFTPSPTEPPTLTPSPTATDTPIPSSTPTPDLEATAFEVFLQTQAALSATPNMTQTLSPCIFDYIVAQPEAHDQPPAFTDASNPRLIPASETFEVAIVFENTGNCMWPNRVRLTYNQDLTENPDESLLAPLREVCSPDEIRPGLNFAEQQRSNFFLEGETGISQESPVVNFVGEAPNVFGCYYGVWDLLYPNSTIPIGRPLVLTIRVWGGGG